MIITAIGPDALIAHVVKYAPSPATSPTQRAKGSRVRLPRRDIPYFKRGLIRYRHTWNSRCLCLPQGAGDVRVTYGDPRFGGLESSWAYCIDYSVRTAAWASVMRFTWPSYPGLVLPARTCRSVHHQGLQEVTLDSCAIYKALNCTFAPVILELMLAAEMSRIYGSLASNSRFVCNPVFTFATMSAGEVNVTPETAFEMSEFFNELGHSAKLRVIRRKLDLQDRGLLDADQQGLLRLLMAIHPPTHSVIYKDRGTRYPGRDRDFSGWAYAHLEHIHFQQPRFTPPGRQPAHPSPLCDSKEYTRRRMLLCSFSKGQASSSGSISASALDHSMQLSYAYGR